MKCSNSCGPNIFPTNNNLIEFSALLCKHHSNDYKYVTETLHKEASVCPIFKKEDKNKCDNYRPTSLLPNISKIFESYV